jgi:hypothetical protein
MTAGPAASPVLTTSSTVSCKHGGVVSAAGDAKLKVGASSVLTRADVVGKGISGCLTVDNAQTSTLQCRWVSSVSSGTSSKL